ncbi:hypothetical protein QVD17_15078 [Tagetes erecta]|uniref:RRM domain-containing protein n=1 Tax=Tagetes erecta TaxID=13708 RepID=A0AAD8NZ73_TARER|nr:hypothetical protein QVD17_15078 [Tagetes erecta]
MMRKPTGHKEKYSIKSEISRTYSDDGTAARTRPFSFDDIMLRRRNKKQSDSVEDQGVVLEMVSGRVESDRHRRRDFVDNSERLGSKEPLKVSSRTKEKVMESEYKESHNNYRRSKIDDDTTRDSRKERGVNEKRKNQDRPTDDFDREHRKIYDDGTRDSRKERVVHEKRKNQDRQIDDFDHEHGKIYDDSKRNSRKERVVHEKRKNQDRQIDDFDHEHGKIYDDSTRDSRKERAGHEKRKNQDRPTNDFEKSYDDSTRGSRKERVDHEKRKNQEWPTNDFEREQGKIYDDSTRDRRKERVDHEKRKNQEWPTDDFEREQGMIYDDSTRDRRKERVVHEKRKNHDTPTDDFEREHGKRYSKDYAVKDRDRGRSEHVSKRSQNVYDDIGKKDESRKWQDPATIEKKQNKSTSEFHHEDLKSRSKRSRSREHERDKSKRSRSPSPRGQKQRYYDAREHEELSSHSSKDGKKVSNNGSDNKIKRHDASTSGLGGYSPRKRRSEGAIKMPSLSNRSPEKKTVGWDSPPVKMESSFPSSNKTESSNRHDVASLGQPLTPSIPKPTFGVLSSFPAMMNVSVDSIQLTQATRPKRRVYVENLPASASEAAVMQWLSGYLRPFGLNHVQGTSPCISCIVNKEKGQALVEFLTPEDASAALNFDGKSFSGNIIKIRRPKDYIESSVFRQLLFSCRLVYWRNLWLELFQLKTLSKTLLTRYL